MELREEAGGHHALHGDRRGFGWHGENKANLGHFVDKSKQSMFRVTLKIPCSSNNSPVILERLL